MKPIALSIAAVVVAASAASSGASASIAFDGSSRFTADSSRILEGGGAIAHGASLAPHLARAHPYGLLARSAALPAGSTITPEGWGSGLLATAGSGVRETLAPSTPQWNDARSVATSADDLPTPPRLMNALLLMPDAGTGYAFDVLDQPGDDAGAAATASTAPATSLTAPRTGTPSPWIIGATSIALIGFVLSRRRSQAFGYRVVLVQATRRGQ